MTQFTVEHIWPLDPTKKSGGFKGTDGVNYYCEIGAYHMLSKGVTYNADVRPYVSKAGKQSFIVDKAWHPPVTVVGATTAAPAPSQPAPAAPTVTPAAPPPAGNSRDVQIASIALMKSFIETGKFGLTDLPMLEGACIPAAKRIVAGS